MHEGERRECEWVMFSMDPDQWKLHAQQEGSLPQTVVMRVTRELEGDLIHDKRYI